MKLKTLKSPIKTLGSRIHTVEATSWRAGTASSTQRGYTYKWQQERAKFLALHPLCQCPECDEGRIRVRISNVVDHRIAHGGDQKLFWDKSNWMAMAKPCHDKKTATQDGGFGRQATHQKGESR